MMRVIYSVQTHSRKYPDLVECLKGDYNGVAVKRQDYDDFLFELRGILDNRNRLYYTTEKTRLVAETKGNCIVIRENGKEEDIFQSIYIFFVVIKRTFVPINSQLAEKEGGEQ